MKIAVLDDYQNVASSLAVWDSLAAEVCGHFGNSRGGRASDRRNPRMAAGFSGD